MGTTAQKLNKILETKEAIRTAINNKGGTLTTTDTFASYPSAIDSLPSGGGEGTSLKDFITERGTKYLYYNYTGSTITKLKASDLEGFTDLSFMFYQCTNLVSIPTLNFNIVKSIEYTFYYCNKLESINLGISSIRNINYAFNNCEKLQGKIKFTNAISYANWAFYNCYLIDTVIFEYFPSSFNDRMFFNCYSLKNIVIKKTVSIPSIKSSCFYNNYHFTGTVDATYNPGGLKDGAIYVPDDKVDNYKSDTNWSVYADIIKPLSEYVEE